MGDANHLEYNQIGDEGVRHLSDALARGAAPALKQRYNVGLNLDGNPASDAAHGALRLMAKHRCRPEQLLDGARRRRELPLEPLVRGAPQVHRAAGLVR